MSSVDQATAVQSLCPAGNARFLRQLYALFLATPTEALTAEGALIVQAGSREAELLLGVAGADSFEAARDPLRRLAVDPLNGPLSIGPSAVHVYLSSKPKGKRFHVRFWGRNGRRKVDRRSLPVSLAETGELVFSGAASIDLSIDEKRDARPVLNEKRDARPVLNDEVRSITYERVSLPLLNDEDEARRVFWEILGEDGVLAAIARGDVTEDEVRIRTTEPQPEAWVPDVPESFDFTDEASALFLAVIDDFDETATQLTGLGDLDEFDAESWVAEISSKLPSVEPKQRLTVSLSNEVPEPWLTVAQKTVSAVVDRCSRYQKADRLPPPPRGETKDQKAERRKVEKELAKLLRPGRLCVLTPSPGTGKSRGMIDAMLQDRRAGKQVGYAVLSREQILETQERVRERDRYISLHVIEGRHASNCSNHEEVKTSAALGYRPGTYVCPSCEMYPSMKNPKGSVHTTCGYYRKRLLALIDRDNVEESPLRYCGQPTPIYPIILTTHSAMALGVNELREKRLGEIWNFDTIFVDEDPSSSLEQTLCIDESQLTYYHEKADSRETDAHTQFTAVIREAIAMAKRDRSASGRRGFFHPIRTTEKDPVHTREHGSTFSGDEWIDLAARSAGALDPGSGKSGLVILTELLAAVINDERTPTRNVPKRGELLDLHGEDLARRFPHRHLDVFAKQMHDEIMIRDSNKGLRGLAYNIHLDLAKINEDDFLGTGPHWGSLTMHAKMRWKEQAPNIVVGDAYADVDHYMYLFDKRDQSLIDVVNFKAKWPETATLVQVRTHASKSDVRTRDAFRDHLDANIYTALHRFERDRSVLFYTHKSHRTWLGEWLDEHAAGLQLTETAIEHWGSGRGKDIYRHFDTFVAVTEFLPNIGGLVHAANARIFDMRLRPELPADSVSSGTAPLRIDFWNQRKPRVGGEKLSHTMEDQHPILVGDYERRTIDELAQAVHRIRPAIPTEGGRHKHMWIFGFRTPLSKELVAATDFVAPEGGLREMAEQALRGQRTVTEALFTVDSSRDLAMQIGATVERIGCWGTPFAHSALNPLCAILRPDADSNDIHADPLHSMSPNAERTVAILRDKSLSTEHYGSSLGRLFSPPKNWDVLAGRLSNQTLYRGAVKRVLADMPVEKQIATTVHRPWMPRGSHGHDCIGDPVRFAEILDRCYSPSALAAPPVPF